MANVNIKFNNKDYLLSCDDGQEESLKKLTKFLDKKYTELKDKLGNIGENKLLLITTIQLIDDYFDLKQKVTSQKKKLDLNNEDIVKNVLKAKEKEKNKITKRLGDLTVEEREVENILKNQRLGDWSLGQTRALYEYDADQYDKERQEIEDDMLMELRLNRNDEVTERNREIYRLEAIEEQVQRERVNAEMMAVFAAMPDDDDYGDRDGDEGF